MLALARRGCAIFFSLLAGVAGCSSVPAEDGASSSSEEVIEGSAAAKEERYDAVVALVPAKAGADGTRQAFCTGTLIERDLVLTADHCVANERLAPADVLVAVGADATRPRATYEVTGFDRTRLARLPGDVMTGGEDAVVLRLATSVPDVRPIEAAPVRASDVGAPAIAIGFGFSDGARTKRSVRLMGTTKIVELRDAFEMQVGERGEDSRICQGDSGGPLLVERDGKLAVVGVLSRTSLDARAECANPATYVRLVARTCANGARIGETTCVGNVWKRCANAGDAKGPVTAEIDCAALLPPSQCDSTARGFACKVR